MRSSLLNKLQQIERDLPMRSSPQLASAVRWAPSGQQPVHRWFRYREGFSPELFQHLPKTRARLDPFCGCGTTLLESMRQHVDAFGVDVNPLATFIARTKTRPYSQADRREFLRIADAAARDWRRTVPVPRPSYTLLRKAFLSQSLDTLLRLRAFLECNATGRVRDLLLLAWLSILEECSNVFKEGNGLKYRNKRRKPGRYITLPDATWIPRHFGRDVSQFVLRAWTNKCALIATDLEGLPTRRPSDARVRTGSCLDPAILDFGRAFDLVVFSPPYANRFDYFEAFKIELWLGGFVESSQDLARLRKLSMRNNLAAARSTVPPTWPLLAPFLDVMQPDASSVRMGIKETLNGYFEDMRLLLRNLREVMTTRGQVAIVVGNSAYARSIVPTDCLVAHVAREEGYRVQSIQIARHLHVSSQQRPALGGLTGYMRESLLLLSNNSR